MGGSIAGLDREYAFELLQGGTGLVAPEQGTGMGDLRGNMSRAEASARFQGFQSCCRGAPHGCGDGPRACASPSPEAERMAAHQPYRTFPEIRWSWACVISGTLILLKVHRLARQAGLAMRRKEILNHKEKHKTIKGRLESQAKIRFGGRVIRCVRDARRFIRRDGCTGQALAAVLGDNRS